MRGREREAEKEEADLHAAKKVEKTCILLLHMLVLVILCDKIERFHYN